MSMRRAASARKRLYSIVESRDNDLMKPTTFTPIRVWKDRWDAVRRQELEGLKNASPALRLRQLTALMRMGKSLGWFEKMRAPEEIAAEEEVRRRWMKIKKAYRAQKE